VGAKGGFSGRRHVLVSEISSTLPTLKEIALRSRHSWENVFLERDV